MNRRRHRSRHSERGSGRPGRHRSSCGGADMEIPALVGDAEDETGIHEMVNGTSVNGKWYNLSGQRVNRAQKGIFIVNGKKVVK